MADEDAIGLAESWKDERREFGASMVAGILARHVLKQHERIAALEASLKAEQDDHALTVKTFREFIEPKYAASLAATERDAQRYWPFVEMIAKDRLPPTMQDVADAMEMYAEHKRKAALATKERK